MANPHPTPRLENLRQPWPSGTSGNPAGYSRGRRISDAIENMIDEQGLERSFAATAIAMALGHKHTLRQLVKDPVTGVDVWVEHKPDLAWFKMIVPRPRVEPAAQQPDAVTRLRTILQNIDRKEREAADQGKAAESPERSQSDPCHVNEQAESTGALFQDVPAQAGSGHNSLATRHSPLATFQDVPAHAGSGQVALQAAQADLPAGDPGTTLAVERPSAQRSVPILRGLLELFNPARHAVRLMAFVEAQLAGLFTGNSRGFAAGIIRVRPRLAGGLGRRWRRSPSWLACCSFTRPSSSMTSVLTATSFRRERARLTSLVGWVEPKARPTTRRPRLSGGPRLRLDPPYRRGSSLTSLHAIWLPARSWPGKLRPPSDPGDQVHVSGVLSGACTGKAPGWRAGPNVENLRTGTRNVSSQSPKRPILARCWRAGEMMTTASLPTKSIDATLQDLLKRSRRDPCYFNDHVLRRSPYWRAQREWALTLVDHRIVAVKTGNGLGKGW